MKVNFSVIDNFVTHFNKHLLHKLLGDGREGKDWEERQGKLISVIKTKTTYLTYAEHPVNSAGIKRVRVSRY